MDSTDCKADTGYLLKMQKAPKRLAEGVKKGREMKRRIYSSGKI